VCVVSEVLCSVSDGHYTESNNYSISDEEKGETRVVEARLPFTSYAKKEYLQIILQRILLVPTHSMTVGSHTRMYVCQWSLCRPGARSTAWSTSCVTFLKHLDCHGF
jgi:hypothetical protein